MTAPALVPATYETGIPARSSTFSTPSCATALAPPPARATPSSLPVVHAQWPIPRLLSVPRRGRSKALRPWLPHGPRLGRAASGAVVQPGGEREHDARPEAPEDKTPDGVAPRDVPRQRGQIEMHDVAEQIRRELR